MEQAGTDHPVSGDIRTENPGSGFESHQLPQDTGLTGANEGEKMVKYNNRAHQTQPAVMRASSVMGTVSRGAPDTRTHQGGIAWLKDPQTDLFLRSTSSFHGNEKSFYEDGAVRDQKVIDLVRQLAVEDWHWTAPFLGWLRGPGNIRTAALILACEAVDARLKAGLKAPENSVYPSNREVVASVLLRADEPGEMLAYWTARHGRAIPKPIKRGIADAVRRLYREKSLLKYDTVSHSFRFGDVLNLVHATPDPDKHWQGALFQYALDRRHHPQSAEIPAGLPMLRMNRDLRASDDVKLWLSPTALSSAGMTWEDALSAVGSKVNKAKLWEALIPSMGYMAALRNLRNFDEAGVSNLAANRVVVMLCSEDEVRRSRQLPFRFLSAYKNAPSLRWGYALETALDLCLPNVPKFRGRTLVLVDSSGSMDSKMSGKSTMSCLSAAALFGAVTALRNEGNVDLWHFADRPEQVPVPRGGSILRLAKTVEKMQGRVGWGTAIGESVRATYKGHDRVLIFSDGATHGGYKTRSIDAAVPAHVPVYLFNLRGYSESPMPTGSAARFDLGGLTDATFALIPRLEAGINGVWPWEIEETA